MTAPSPSLGQGSNGTGETALLLLRLRAEPAPTSLFVTVSMYVHLFYFICMSATSFLHLRHVRRLGIAPFAPSSSSAGGSAGGPSGVSSAQTGQLLVLAQILLTTLHEVSYLSFFPGGTRASAVTGDRAFNVTQLGYLNSPPTPWCSFTGVLLYVSLSYMLLNLCALIVNAYKVATSVSRVGMRRRISFGKHTSSTWRRFVAPVLRNPWYTVSFVLPLASALVQIINADQGPMGAYCGIRCRETGIDAVYTSNGACWTRLTSFYGLCVCVAPPTVFYAVKLVRHVWRVHKSTKVRLMERASAVAKDAGGVVAGGTRADGGRERGGGATERNLVRQQAKIRESERLQMRLVLLAILLSVVSFAGALVRVPSSVSPSGETEGRLSVAEYVPLVMSPLVCFTFSMKLWAECARRAAAAAARVLRGRGGGEIVRGGAGAPSTGRKVTATATAATTKRKRNAGEKTNRAANGSFDGGATVMAPIAEEASTTSTSVSTVPAAPREKAGGPGSKYVHAEAAV